jgi:hypothetical protein
VREIDPIVNRHVVPSVIPVWRKTPVYLGAAVVVVVVVVVWRHVSLNMHMQLVAYNTHFLGCSHVGDEKSGISWHDPISAEVPHQPLPSCDAHL